MVRAEDNKKKKGSYMDKNNIGTVNFLTEMSEFTLVSKYARYNPIAERRETWLECVGRTEAMHLSKFKKVLPKEDLKRVEQAFNAVREKQVVPSMRSLQYGGKAIEANELRLYNCGKITTKFITSAGVKSFEDFTDGDEVVVLTHTGKWQNAIVRSYGQQQLNKITFKRFEKTFIEYFTPNHRWMLRNGEITTDLKIGDILRCSENIFNQFVYDTAEPFEKLYWAYGFIYGDGTKIKNEKNEYRHSMVRLCGEKLKYLSRFEELGFHSSSSLSLKGDAMVYTGTYLKTPPNPLNDSPVLIKAFVAGYLAADGAKNQNDTGTTYRGIQSSEQEHINFIRLCFPIAGVFILQEKELTNQPTNYGIRPYTISFLTYDAPNNENGKACFKVDAIEKSTIETVWCLEVEEDATFVLPNGLITGNCSMRHLDSIRAFAEIMFLSMSGCGIGIGLYKKFINRLPDLVNADDKTGTIITYCVEDSCEGWSDSFEALLNCYMKNTAYTGRKIVFDYSRVRKAGSPLKTSGGKAPGHKGLKNAHIKIKELLDHIIEELHLNRLRSIDIYDILMHSVDATLSGGSRRSATIVLFDKDDTDMMKAKVNFPVTKHTRFVMDKDINRWCGRVTVNKKKHEVELTDYEYNELLLKQNQVSWIHIEPQRARSNNTIRLVREETTQEEVDALIEHTKMYGEPGFFFVNKAADDALCNPCLSSSVSVTCVDSVKSIADVQIGEKIWSSEGWTTVIQKWNNGIKPTFKYVTEKGVIEATANHKFMSRGVKTAAKDCEDIDFNDGMFYPVVDVVATGEQEVFDIAVDNQSHTFYANGFNVSNCAEIVTIPITKDGVSGVQNCNLTEINGKALTSLADLIQAAENAAIIGTLQAAYTKFKYLGNASREITEEEALLGISITGLLDNPKICLNEEYLTTAAQWACETNELWAKKLGINPAARLTCIKPSGTVGVVLQTSSGIHPHHANKYFRRIQCNKHDPVFQYFKKHNPHMVEESVWSANKTDEVVTFPIYVNGETIVKKDLTALQHMEMIKKVYNAWVKPGTSKYNKKPITHNISCTVLVKDDEWADVSKYLYENRDAFTAMSFLPAIGDKLYKQAPFESVITEEDEAKYQALIASYKPVDYKKLKELEDTTTVADTSACAGGACQL